MEDPLSPTQTPEEATERTPRATAPTYFPWARLVWFVATVVNVLCGLRFVLRLLGASTTSPFVNLVYSVSDPLVAPFRGIFPQTGSGPFVWEPAALVAIVVYALIAAGLVALFRIMASPGRRRPAGID